MWSATRDIRLPIEPPGCSAAKSPVLNPRARDVMTKSPKTVAPDALALDAVTLMNDKQITQLFVTGKDGKLAGIVRLHDLLAAKIV